MSTKKCCRTCQHCCIGQNSVDVWCRLRKIGVHPDIAIFALCHHWTQRPPSLPKIQEKIVDNIVDQQLEFDRELVAPDRF